MKLTIFPAILFSLLFSNCQTANNAAADLVRRGEDAAFENDHEQAVVSFREAIRIDKNNWRAYYDLGSIYATEGKFDSSLYYYDRSIKLHPQFALAWSGRANVKAILNDEQGAMVDYEKALALNSSLKYLWVQKARRAYDLQDWGSAIRLYDSVLHNIPDATIFYCMRGVARYKAGDDEGALQDLNRGLMKWPGNMSLMINKASVLIKLKQYDSAMELCDAALERKPEDLSALIDKAICLSMTGRKDEAKVVFERAGAYGQSNIDDYILKYCHN